MPKWEKKKNVFVGENVSKPGERMQTYKAYTETKSGNRTIIAEFPTKDEAVRMFQTLRMELRTECKKPHGTWLRLVQVMKISNGKVLSWNEEHQTLLNEALIKPYTSLYSSRLRKIREKRK